MEHLTPTNFIEKTHRFSQPHGIKFVGVMPGWLAKMSEAGLSAYPRFTVAVFVKHYHSQVRKRDCRICEFCLRGDNIRVEGGRLTHAFCDSCVIVIANVPGMKCKPCGRARFFDHLGRPEGRVCKWCDADQKSKSGYAPPPRRKRRRSATPPSKVDVVPSVTATAKASGTTATAKASNPASHKVARLDTDHLKPHP
jgi:YgiT-type zinc finger domain-containing protein